MPDNDEMVLEDAGAVVFTLEKALRRAVRNGDPGALRAIKPQHKKALQGLARARMKLIEGEQIATDADVAEMRRIKGEIDQAADSQQLVEGAIKFAGFIAKFV
jgi:hypothetical protein